MSEPTKRPWYISDKNGWHVLDSEGGSIAIFQKTAPTDTANARFAVQAVNAYASHRAALRACVEHCQHISHSRMIRWDRSADCPCCGPARKELEK